MTTTEPDSLFPDDAIPPAPGGLNLAAAERAIKAGREANVVQEVDELVVELVRSAARAMDTALRSKAPAYAVAALLKPAHEVAASIGLGGRVALTPDGPAPAGKSVDELLGLFSGDPVPASAPLEDRRP